MVWFQNMQQVLKQQFDEYDVQGQIGQHPNFGPIFTFALAKDDKQYACGFFLSELLHAFQHKQHPELWLSSFYVDMLREGVSKPLPNPPQSEDEAKALIDGQIVPHCATTVREEYSDEAVHVDLELHPEHGPVLEAGFPSIKEGNNTCAMPLHFLFTLYLLNRDPAEPLLAAMETLKEQLQSAQA
jgi:hypothetical protein